MPVINKVELRIRFILFLVLNPLFRFIGNIEMPYSIKKCNGKTYYDIVKLKLRPGSIFLTKIEGELVDLVIPGKIKHAAMYIGNEQVVEAVGGGVRKVDLVSFVTSKDHIYVLEPNIVKDKKAIMEEAAKYVLKKVGEEYDFSLTASKHKFYCSKLEWFGYNYACHTYKHQILFNPRVVLGVPMVTPEDILTNKNFEVIYDSEAIK
jgi:uncharacterized protein YycO